MRSQMLLFLGPEDLHSTNHTETSIVKTLETDFFNGTFYLDSSENFGEYLTELGVGYFLRQLAMLAFPIVSVQRFDHTGLQLLQILPFQVLSFGKLGFSLHMEY